MSFYVDLLGEVASNVVINLGALAGNSATLISGSLPPGLIGETSDNGVNLLWRPVGTPIQVGIFEYNIWSPITGDHKFEVVWGSEHEIIFPAGCSAITVSPATLSDGYTGSGYSVGLSASGGTSPYTLTLESGILPLGLSLASGAITGTPTTGGTSLFVVRATATGGCVGFRSYSLTINVVPVVTSLTPDQGTTTGGTAVTITGTNFDAAADVLFDVTPATSIVVVNSTTITCIPPTHNCGLVNVSVSNDGINYDTLSNAYTYSNLVVITPASPLANGAANTGWALTLAGSGGVAPYTFALNAGAFPTGLTLTSAGLLSGTPTVADTFAFTIRATDADACVGDGAYTLIIDPLPPSAVLCEDCGCRILDVLREDRLQLVFRDIRAARVPLDPRTEVVVLDRRVKTVLFENRDVDIECS